ncbi:hypothetical protein XHC_2162 [Xanthomonas hortorum pv. carotae str. M081]|nr:hypothetical protein XHC_2162 [Xanthomonas hortorum pv. carotae str. M081]
MAALGHGRVDRRHACILGTSGPCRCTKGGNAVPE